MVIPANKYIIFPIIVFFNQFDNKFCHLVIFGDFNPNLPIEISKFADALHH
jgi:hypothetical protein